MSREKSEAQLRDSIHRCGKLIFSEKEQIRILYLLLEDAKSKLVKDNELYKFMAETQLKLKGEENLKEAIGIVNAFVIALEAKDLDQVAVNYLKQHGFYRILYRNSQIIGEELPSDDILRKLLRNGFIGVGVSALIILLFTSTVFFAAPFWLTAITNGLFVGASTYLSGILYGVVNDLFATHSNLPYFLLGHQPQQKSLLKTNDKVAQGVAWGVAATFVPVVIATMVFTVAATITAFFVPMATFLLPAMMIAMPMIAIGAEFYARKKAREYLEQDKEFYWIGSNTYQRDGLDYMCPTKPERAAWYANSDRNMFGFTKVPFVGLAALIGLIVLSALSKFLSSLLFALPIIAMAIPAAFATAACVTLIALGAYMYVNRNKQIDDRYRLEFERSEVEPNLYFDEDMIYVHDLVQTYTKQEPCADLDFLVKNSSANVAFFDRKSTHKTPEIQQEEPHQEDGDGLVYRGEIKGQVSIINAC